MTIIEKGTDKITPKKPPILLQKATEKTIIIGLRLFCFLYTNGFITYESMILNKNHTIILYSIIFH